MDEKRVRNLYKKITEKLIERKMTITAMESCTSGEIASLITDTEGSSAVLKGSLITYSNEAKILFGVPEEVITDYSVYSEETAFSMAEKCRELFCADIGIGVTGTFGNPDPYNIEDSVLGEVWFAIITPNASISRLIKLKKEKERYQYKLQTAYELGCILLEIID